MTTFRIQKTIISKYIDLVNKDKATESEISELLQAIFILYKNRILTDSDCFKHKLDLIIQNLNTHLNGAKHKRIAKEIKIEEDNELLKILISDLENVDYSKSILSDLDKFENEKELNISLENVKLVLENLIVAKRRLNAESDLERFLHERLSMVFGKDRVFRQYSIGGFLALKTDIDIGNGQVGVEIKVADHLTATEMQRMIGQVTYYRKRYYNNNLIVFLAGKSSMTPTIKELRDFIEELGTKVIYIQAIL